MKPSVQLAILIVCLVAMVVAVTALLWPSAPGRIEVALPTATPQPEIRVHVNGAVLRPGVYTVQQGDRLEDVLAMAGGLTDDADPQRVNPSLRAGDEAHFYIPRIGEQIESPEASPDETRVNINTASSEELQTLPGIGPGRADAIIEYRQGKDGPFSRGEDLLLVPGLGPKTVDGLLDFVSAEQP